MTSASETVGIVEAKKLADFVRGHDIYCTARDGRFKRVADALEQQAATIAELRDDEFWMSLIEPVTKAIVFEDCGNTADWKENTNLGIAAVNKIRTALAKVQS